MSASELKTEERTDQPPELKLDVRPDPHIMDYLLVIAKHKWVVSILIVAGGVIGFWVTMFVPYEYEARSTMLPPDRASSSGLLSAFNAGGAMKMLKMVENPSVDLIQDIVESRTACRQVANDSLIAHFYKRYIEPEGKFDEPGTWIRASTDCEAGLTKLNIHTILETGWRPTEEEKTEARFTAAAISNVAVRVVNQFLDSMVRQESHVRRAMAESELQARVQEIDSLERELQVFESEHSIASLPEQISTSVELQSSLQSAVLQAEIEQRLAATDLTQDALSSQSAALNLSEARRTLQEYQSKSGLGFGLSALPAVQKQYADLKVQVKSLDPIILFLRQEVEQQKINEERNRSMAQLLDSADVPSRKSAPKRLIYLLVGLTAGVAVSFFYVGFIAFLRSAASYNLALKAKSTLVEEFA